MGEGHERGDGQRNRSAETCGEKARLKAKKNRPLRAAREGAWGRATDRAAGSPRIP
nr:MAG TPA: hypothetical protein [Caudoviricetes sp.]